MSRPRCPNDACEIDEVAEIREDGYVVYFSWCPWCQELFAGSEEVRASLNLNADYNWCIFKNINARETEMKIILAAAEHIDAETRRRLQPVPPSAPSAPVTLTLWQRILAFFR